MSDKVERVKMFRLFEKTAKSGMTYLTGVSGGMRVVAFRSEYDDSGVVWDVYCQKREDTRKPDDKPEAKSDDKIPF